MKLLYTTDIHTNRKHLSALLETAEREGVGALVIGGDVTPKELFERYLNKLVPGQRKYLQTEFVPALERFRRANPNMKLFLDLGNDDFSANRDILETAEREGVFHLLHMAVYPLDDNLDIVGYMGVPLTPFLVKDWERPDKRGEYPPSENRATPNGYVSTLEGGTGLLKHKVDIYNDTTIEEELAELEKRITRPFVFICHTPPYGTSLDMLYSGLHVGSVAVREFIERWAEKGLLRASFHGHIHESPRVSGSVVDYIADIECHNPGQTETELKYTIWETEGPRPTEEETPGHGR
jgi:uncharacterized protein